MKLKGRQRVFQYKGKRYQTKTLQIFVWWSESHKQAKISIFQIFAVRFSQLKPAFFQLLPTNWLHLGGSLGITFLRVSLNLSENEAKKQRHWPAWKYRLGKSLKVRKPMRLTQSMMAKEISRLKWMQMNRGVHSRSEDIETLASKEPTKAKRMS